jgi:hypothetical protein
VPRRASSRAATAKGQESGRVTRARVSEPPPAALPARARLASPLLDWCAALRPDARCRDPSLPFPQARAESGNEADHGTARSRDSGGEQSDAEEGAAGSSGSSNVGGNSDSDFELESDDGRPKLRSRPARRPSPPRPARTRPHGRPTRSSAAASRAPPPPPARRSGRSAGRPSAGRYAESDGSGSD